MKTKTYTLAELKEKYWDFKKIISTKTASYDGGQSGAGGSYQYIDYPNTIEGFLLWLENFLWKKRLKVKILLKRSLIKIKSLDKEI